MFIRYCVLFCGDGDDACITVRVTARDYSRFRWTSLEMSMSQDWENQPMKLRELELFVNR